MTDQDDAFDQRYDSALLRRLLTYLRPYRGLTTLAVLLLLAGAGLALVGPALTQRAIDVANPARDTGRLATLGRRAFGVRRAVPSAISAGGMVRATAITSALRR